MGEWMFKPRVDGQYLGVGEHSVLVAHDAPAGYVVTVDGYRVAWRHNKSAAMRAGTAAARWIDKQGFESAAVPTLTDHLTPTTKETTMTTTKARFTPAERTALRNANAAIGGVLNDQRSASAVRSANRRARLKAEAAPPQSTRERILAAHVEQQTVGQIAELVGVSQNRVRQVLAATGTVRPKHRDQARNDAIMAAIDAGATVAEQAAKYGLGESRVRTIYQVAKAAS